METLITDERNAVQVSKTVTTRPDATTLQYRVEPTAASRARVRLVERLPDPVEESRVVFPTADDPGGWTYRDDSQLVYEVDLSGAAPVETTALVATSLDPDGLATDLAVVDRSDSVTGGGRTVSDGSGTVDTATNGHVSDPAPAESTTSGARGQQRDAPAVGIAETDDLGAVARTTVDATDHGLDVFVARATDSESPSVRVARRLGATVVEPGVDNPDPEAVRTSLAVAARSRSYPGLVVLGDPSRGLQVEESLAAFAASDDAVVEAVTAELQTGTLAGIPAYNEADTVGDVVERAREFVDEVIVVDDGSDDETADRARMAGATVVEHDRNRGYGHALKTLFGAADDRSVDHLVVLDADSQHDPADIPRLLNRQRETGAQLVIGSRFAGDADTAVPIYRRVGLGVIKRLVNVGMGGLFGGDRVTDAQSGFRAYDGAAVASLASTPGTIDDRMGASTDILHHAFANDFGIAEVNTTIDYDVANANTMNPVRHGLMVVSSITTTLERERPVAVLGAPGALVVLLGLVGGFTALSATATTGTAPFGLVLLSALLLVVGTPSMMAAVVLHALKMRVGGQRPGHGTP